jgi:hypothetical protein
MKASFAVLRTLLVPLLCVLCSLRAGPQTPPALGKITSQFSFLRSRTRSRVASCMTEQVSSLRKCLVLGNGTT